MTLFRHNEWDACKACDVGRAFLVCLGVVTSIALAVAWILWAPRWLVGSAW